MNKFVKRLIIVITLFCTIANSASAQTDIKIIDFGVLPQMENDTTIDSLTLKVRFKVNHPEQANNAVLWLGTARDSSNVFSVQPVFSVDNGSNYLIHEGQNIPIPKYEVIFDIKLSEAQFANYISATLYIETNDGPTTRLYYDK